MLAPIALYPDALLTQILMASTYPMEVVESARWSRANPNFHGDEAVRAIRLQRWDPSVISLVAFPEILQMMDDKLDWTERLGDAFLAQEPEVMDSVQNLRQRAYAAGNLVSNDQFRVIPQGQTIVVEPSNPELVYVPYYDPTVVYGSWWWSDYPPVFWDPWPGYYMRPGLAYGFAWGNGIPIAAGFFFGDFDWRHRRVNVVNVHNYYFNRPVNNGRNDQRSVNISPGMWQHDPAHRLGVPYRAPSVRQQFGRTNTSQESRRDFRGYNQPAVINSGGIANNRNPAANSNGVPNRTDPRAEHRANPVTQVPNALNAAGSTPVNRPNERTPQTRPPVQTPMAVNRPPIETRPHALEGIERGADVQNHSARGRASFDSAAHIQNNMPVQQPANNVQPVNRPREEKKHPQEIGQSPDSNHDTAGQRKP